MDAIDWGKKIAGAAARDAKRAAKGGSARHRAYLEKMKKRKAKAARAIRLAAISNQMVAISNQMPKTEEAQKGPIIPD